MQPSPDADLQTVSQALRRLAVDLVGAGDADDLVQDTWVQALSLGDAKPRSLKGYVFTALKGLASKHHRTEHRRRKREQAAAREDMAPPADLEVQLSDLLHRLNQALLTLPEPYKGALLLRYLQEMTPTEIAKFKGEPLATIKSRLQRGLEMLRKEMDRRDKDWRTCVPFLLPWRQPAPAATSSAVQTMALAATTLTAIALGVWWSLGSSEQETIQTAAQSGADQPVQERVQGVVMVPPRRILITDDPVLSSDQPTGVRTPASTVEELEDAVARIRIARLTSKEREAEAEHLRQQGNLRASQALFTEGIVAPEQRLKLWQVLIDGVRHDLDTGACTALSVIARLAQESADDDLHEKFDSEKLRQALRDALSSPSQEARHHAASALSGFGTAQDLEAIAFLPEVVEGSEEHRMAFAITCASILTRLHHIGETIHTASLLTVLERISDGGSEEGCEVLLRSCLVHQRLSHMRIPLPPRLRTSQPQHADLLEGLIEVDLFASVQQEQVQPDLAGLAWSLRHAPDDLKTVLASLKPEHADLFAAGATAGFHILDGTVPSEVTERVPTEALLLPPAWTCDLPETTVSGRRVDFAAFPLDMQRWNFDEPRVLAAWHTRAEPPLVSRGAACRRRRESA